MDKVNSCGLSGTESLLGQKILIVDDEEPLRRLYKTELEKEGYTTLVASNAREAMSIAESESLDLIIMDVRMPGMDGIEAIHKILGKKPSMPVIINSAFPNFKKSFMTWVAEEYVIKSPDLKELKDKIRTCLTQPQE
jgi:DNA-binding response OmpR family regulator